MNPVKNHLVALGSAAVLTVYSAGFLRTKSAADRFAAADAERGRAVATTEHTPSEAPAVPGIVQSSDPAPVPQQTAAVAKAASTPVITDKAAAPEPLPATQPIASSAVVAPTKVEDSTILAHVVPPPVAVVVTTPASSQSAATTTQSADTAQTAAKDRGSYKDGTYSGWGTSRHGDIQASVEIRDGHIASAWISQCLTRYPCSRIASLIPQVAARQSANVDYISGATQSSNAFYYAIAEALSHAK